jgi:hypothetical protein
LLEVGGPECLTVATTKKSHGAWCDRGLASEAMRSKTYEPGTGALRERASTTARAVVKGVLMVIMKCASFHLQNPRVSLGVLGVYHGRFVFVKDASSIRGPAGEDD